MRIITISSGIPIKWVTNRASIRRATERICMSMGIQEIQGLTAKPRTLEKMSVSSKLRCNTDRKMAINKSLSSHLATSRPVRDASHAGIIPSKRIKRDTPYALRVTA